MSPGATGTSPCRTASAPSSSTAGWGRRGTWWSPPTAMSSWRCEGEAAAPAAWSRSGDTDGDGRADVTRAWGDRGASGIALHDGTLYLATDNAVLRYALPDGSLTPTGSPETIVDGLPSDRNHATKSVALHPDGSIFVGIGSPSNACQISPPHPRRPGQGPLRRAGHPRRRLALRHGPHQPDPGRRGSATRPASATGRRWPFIPGSGELYGVIHGRDQLRELWPQHYSQTDGSEKPSEEFARITRGSDFGWPYCYPRPQRRPGSC